MIRRLLLIIGIFAGLSAPLGITSSAAALPVNGFASFLPACDQGGVASNTAVCGDVNSQSANNNIFITIIKDVIDVISFAVGVAAIYILIISALRMTGSGGDSKAAADARRGIVGALAGIVVVLFAQTFVIFVLDRIK